MTCPRCAGTGEVPNDRAMGAAMRTKRERARVGLREMARRVRLSPSYLCHLEHGENRWSPEMIELYKRTLR